jgi:hypothetical protein
MEISLILGAMLIAGLVRGSSVCSMVCAPGVLSYIASKKANWKEALCYGIFFSIPRILVLTVLGGVIGFLSFTAVSTGFRDISANLSLFSYFLIGLIFFILGIGVFRNMDKKYGCEKKHRLPKTGDVTSFLVLGSAVSIGCVAGTFEGIILSSAFSTLGNNSITACILGASAMFLFAFGLSAPIIVGSMLAGRFSEKIKHLREIRLVGATIMVVSGLLLIATTMIRLII